MEGNECVEKNEQQAKEVLALFTSHVPAGMDPPWLLLFLRLRLPRREVLALPRNFPKWYYPPPGQNHALSLKSLQRKRTVGDIFLIIRRVKAQGVLG